MKRTLGYLICGAAFIFMMVSYSNSNSNTDCCGKCTGSTYCTACKTCNYCAHCNAGGSCGVCGGGKSAPKYYPPIEVKEDKAKSSPKHVVTPDVDSDTELYQVISTTLNLRVMPSTNGLRIYTLSKGDIIVLVEKTGSTWYKVKVTFSDGTYLNGYVAATYLKRFL